MATPSVNGEASMTHLTGGFSSPCSMDPFNTRLASWVRRVPRLGVKPRSRISAKARTKVRHRTIERRT